MYPALIKTYCTLNVKYFPFDSQHCDIQFISWTHNGQQLDIFYNDTMNTAVYYASANQVRRVMWLINASSAYRPAIGPLYYPRTNLTYH